MSNPYHSPDNENDRPTPARRFPIALKSALQMLEINRTVAWAVFTRGWQVVAGFVSFLMISRFLTADEQGYYVTFWSFVGFQSIVELGFTIAILNFSSHEWPNLHLTDDGAIAGDEDSFSRLVSLGRLGFRWFAVGALIFLFVAGTAGFVVFSAKSNSAVQWQHAWCSVVILSALSVWTLPLVSILEGCGQIETVYRFRLWQAVMMNIAVWSCLGLGFGIWAAVASASAKLSIDLYLITVRYRKFFLSFLRPPDGEVLQWRRDIWPMQWRLAVGGIFSFCANFLFAPVMFYHSEALAGRMGMTRQLLTALQSAAQAWVQARVPMFGELIARRDFRSLDEKFRRLFVVSTLVLLAGGLGFLLFLVVLEQYFPLLASRVLSPVPTAIMLLAMLLFQLPFCQTLYLRAHKVEPVMWVTLASNLGIGLSVWLLGIYWADLGAAFGHLLIVLFITVPGIHIIWLRCRRKWHTLSEGSST